jgi:capsular exopolysaccharide synthesis family protein
LILFVVLSTLAAFLITIPQTPVYQAHASVELQDLNENYLNSKQFTPITEGGSLGVLDIQTPATILKSESLVRRVLAKLKPQAGQEHRAGGPASGWRRTLGLPDPEAPSDECVLRAAIANLNVRPVAQTRILVITYDARDPKYASNFVNILAAEFIEGSTEARWEMTQRTSEWLRRQLEDMRVTLERSEDALQTYARRADLMFTGERERTNISEEKLRQLQVELGRVRADRVAKRSRLDAATTPGGRDTMPEILNDPSLRAYQTTLTDLRRQYADLSTVYTPEHEKMRRLQAQISELDKVLEKERGAILARVRHEYEEAERHEKLLDADYARQLEVVSNESERAIRYNILRREVESNRQVYEAMLQRVKEARIASALKPSSVRVVDPATPPRLPYKPKMGWNLALGAFTGVLIGTAFAVFRQRADRTVHDPGEIDAYLNAPELGVIPSAADEFRKRLAFGRFREVGAHSILESELKCGEQVELVTWQHKPSGMADSFRSLLTSILFSSRGARPHILVLTSPSPGEGKTTVATNLGVALAQLGQRVLLIDADLNQPRLHEIFHVETESGLSTVLSETAPGVVADAIRATAIPRLFVLPAGRTVENSASLLHSPRLAQVLDLLKPDFDTILIDTPPVLRLPDARVVGRLAESVILVIRSGRTVRDDAQAVYRRLLDDGTPVLGVVLNDWNPKTSPGGYYGR